MCGSSTDAEDVKKLTEGVAMDMCITDPPYNINYGEITREVSRDGIRHKDIANDNLSNDDFSRFLRDVYTQMLQSLKAGGAYYIWYASCQARPFYGELENVGGVNKEELVWVKNNPSLSRSDYNWQHEPCIYGWKVGATHYFTDSRKEHTVIEDARPNYRQMKKDEVLVDRYGFLDSNGIRHYRPFPLPGEEVKEGVVAILPKMVKDFLSVNDNDIHSSDIAYYVHSGLS